MVDYYGQHTEVGRDLLGTAEQSTGKRHTSASRKQVSIPGPEKGAEGHRPLSALGRLMPGARRKGCDGERRKGTAGRGTKPRPRVRVNLSHG
jgi:hypothetical protein